MIGKHIRRMKSDGKIIIIGGGLSGLYLAYLLKKQGIGFLLIEASSRLGGRIQTHKGQLDTPLELGATWFSDVHKNLLKLVDELGLEKYPQFSEGKSLFQTKSFEPPQEFFVPQSEASSYRLRGGTGLLTDTLAGHLEEHEIILNAKVTAIEETGENVKIVTAEGKEYTANKVVLCLPPQLAASTIKFSSVLPAPMGQLLASVQTWMAGSIKFTIEYSKPFWREKGYSGMLYSHAGIVAEMYDHTNYEGTKYGFTGFLNPGAASYSQEVRREFVLLQLAELLGEEASAPVAYFDKVWRGEYILEDAPVIERPHQNNGHPLLQESQMNGKLFFSGTETSPSYGGYMEGAVVSALTTLKNIL